MAVRIGDVQTFSEFERFDKAQACKVLEEAAEVYAAWQKCKPWYGCGAKMMNERQRVAGGDAVDELIAECADLITATSNLLAGLGVDDMTEPMKRCVLKNNARGHY